MIQYKNVMTKNKLSRRIKALSDKRMPSKKSTLHVKYKPSDAV